MKRIKISSILVFLVSLALLGGIVRAVLSGPTTSPRPTDVARSERVEPQPGGNPDEVRERPAGSWIGGNGLVEPAQPESRIAAPVPGRIAQILVTEGQFVETGAPLVVLDAQVETAQLAAAEAEVASAQAELARIRRGNRREDVQASASDADSARARAELSRGVFERLSALAQTGVATPDEVDRARRQAEADAASAQSADARRRVSELGSRREDVRGAAARLLAAEARRDQSRAQLDRLTVRAPFAGEVLQVKYRVGEYFQPGGQEPLLVLGDTRQLRVRVDVDERDIGRLRAGAAAFAEADAFPGQRFEGRVVELGRRMGRKNIRTDEPTERIDTKILEVVVALDAARGLVPGQRVMTYVAAEPAPAAARATTAAAPPAAPPAR